MWYQKFNMRSQADHCVYITQVINHFIYVSLYVDDMFLVGNDMDLMKEVKQQLSSKFDMKDLGPAHFILGMEIKRNGASKKLWLSQ